MKFEFMEDAVNDICDSIENSPDRWAESTHTLTDRKSGIEYWLGSSAESAQSITEVWNGGTKDQVFSREQGKRVYAALQVMRETKANVAQQRVLDKVRRSARKDVTDAKFSLWQRVKNWWAQSA